MEEYKLRVRIFASVVLAVLGILCGRLVELQLIRGDAYGGESRNNAVRQRWVQPARGAIYDRTGALRLFRQLTTLLRDELDAEPEPATTELFERLQQAQPV